MNDDAARISDELAAKIHALLAGHPAAVQGAAIADLCAIWLSGHLVLDNRVATTRIRRELFEAHCRAIWELVKLYDMRRTGPGN